MKAPPQAGHYRVICADPPWRFATCSDKGKGRSAEPIRTDSASND
jgi:hypothetical protein